MSKRRIRQIGGNALTFLCRLDNLSCSQKSNFSEFDLVQNINLKSEELIIYIHFSDGEQFDRYDLGTIRTLQSRFRDILLVSNSIIPAEFANIPVLKSRNFGRDLGAMRDVLTFLVKSKYSGKIVFLNNSMFWGPEKELVEFISHILGALKPGTFIGPVESLQIRRHFQSFVVALQILDQLNRSEHPLHYIRNWRTKRSLVRFGELPMLKSFLNAGYEAISIVSSVDIRSNLRYISHIDLAPVKKLLDEQVELNPTQHMWAVVYHLGIPGIKKSLVLSNPAQLSDPPSIETINEWNWT